jgi:hypothetical protein
MLIPARKPPRGSGKHCASLGEVKMSVDLYAAIFEKIGGPAWQAHHGMSAATYQTTFNTLVAQGYRLTCVSGYEASGQANYAAIWTQSGGATWQAHHGMTAAQYQTTFNQLVSQGYRLLFVSGYGVNNQDFYAACWDQSPGAAWQAHHAMTAAQYQTTFNQLVAQGFRLRWVSGYVVNNSDLYAAIWDKSAGSVWQAHHRMTASAYITQASTLASQGYQLVCVSGYSFGGTDYYAALWQQPVAAPWVSYVGMPSASYQTLFNQMVAQGYRVVFVDGYEALQPLDLAIPCEVQKQLESEWCWAAVSTSINHFYNPASTVTQCQVVNNQLGRTDCCSNPASSNCNVPGYLDKALQYVGNFASDKGLGTYQDAFNALNAGTPPCIRIGWSGGGGHFIIINGCQAPSYLSVTDPIYGDSIVAYTTFTSGKYQGSGTWTDTFFTKA